MSIIPTPKGTDRSPAAKAICDFCDHTEIVRADYERTAHGEFRVDEGQVLKKLTHNGWSYIKKKLRCPACEAMRKPHQPKPAAEEPMPEPTIASSNDDLRHPSREQKRQIVSLLTEVYDTAAGRYIAGETDKTVADTIGNGVMFGWVAQIREDLFGPDGGNEELEALEADFHQWSEEAAQIAKSCHENIQAALAGLREFNKMRDKISEMAPRIDALKAAIGPRARAV